MTAIENNPITALKQNGAEPHPPEVHACRPVSIYEVHAASWMRVPEDDYRPLTGAELAPKLAEYANRLNFTHVSLMSGFDVSTGFSPEELRRLINRLHDHSLGVILDSPPSEAGSDALERLGADGWHDGETTCLAEGEQPRKLRWDTVWSRNMLHYLGLDPILRKFHHGDLSERAQRPHPENFILALSHDEVSRGRKSLLSKMPGDDWQKFASLRLLLASQWAQPGGKLTFMGGEFGQWNEWNAGASLDWHLVREGSPHLGVQKMITELNRLYQREPALQESNRNDSGIEWGDCSESELSVISWLRLGADGGAVLAVFNFTPVPRFNHRIGIASGGSWREIFNSDARDYGGSGQGNLGGVEASPFGWKSHSHSLTVTLPPLGAVFFKATH